MSYDIVDGSISNAQNKKGWIVKCPVPVKRAARTSCLILILAVKIVSAQFCVLPVSMLHSFSSCDIVQHCYASQFRGYHLLNNTTTNHTLVTSHNTLVTSEQSMDQLSNHIATATHIITPSSWKWVLQREAALKRITLVLYMFMFVCRREHLRVNTGIKRQLSVREHTDYSLDLQGKKLSTFNAEVSYFVLLK